MTNINKNKNASDLPVTNDSALAIVPSENQNPQIERPVPTPSKSKRAEKAETTKKSKDAVRKLIKEFNKLYTTFTSGGKNYVARQGKDTFDKKSLEIFKYKDFIELHIKSPSVNVEVEKDGGGRTSKMINPAKLWLESGQAQNADYGLTFNPRPQKFINGKLNTYMGRGCEPVEYQGSDPLIQIYLDHVFDVICDGNRVNYEYVINWLAHLMQKPEIKVGIAIVLKAGQGTGKGMFLDPIGKIIGSHYLYANSPTQILGNFNAQLENKILVFADEFFAGSTGATDRLKTMITEPVNSIERKGQDRISVPCFARVVMATNHDNVINIEYDERRYLYLNVSEKFKQNRVYFGKLLAAISHPDFSGKLLHFLLNHDINNFDAGAVPKTDALTDQKIDNFKPLHKWIYKMLQDGQLAGNWPERMESDEVSNKAEEWLKLRDLSVWGDTPTKVGKLLKSLGANRIRVGSGKNRKYWREFPKLDEMRANFSKLIGADLEW